MKWRDLFLALGAVALAALITCQPHPQGDLQLAYIGPGAGFAFLGSFLTLITSLVLSIVSLLVWPFRMAWLLVSRRQGFLSEADFKQPYAASEEQGKMLSGLRRSILDNR